MNAIADLKKSLGKNIFSVNGWNFEARKFRKSGKTAVFRKNGSSGLPNDGQSIADIFAKENNLTSSEMTNKLRVRIYEHHIEFPDDVRVYENYDCDK